MRLESVRELKQILPGHLQRAFAAERTAVRQPSLAVASAAALARRGASYFLGVSRKGRRDYRLAVRLQDRALVKSPLVDEITTQAKGEVDVRYVGRVRARARARRIAWFRSRRRPLLIGSSVGYLESGYIMAGTLGCFVRQGRSPSVYILSNNHVLANENRYPKGGPIVQPGTLDGGHAPRDTVARLTAFSALSATRANRVDCAIARLVAGMEPDTRTLTDIGALAGTRSGSLDVGESVHKVGRTTGVRHGRVTAIELDGLVVEYDMGNVSFDDQIEIEGAGRRAFSDAGDSGSLIVDGDRMAAALLFSGADHGGSNRKGVTYGNPIQAVFKALKVRLA